MRFKLNKQSMLLILSLLMTCISGCSTPLPSTPVVQVCPPPPSFPYSRVGSKHSQGYMETWQALENKQQQMLTPTQSTSEPAKPTAK